MSKLFVGQKLWARNLRSFAKIPDFAKFKEKAIFSVTIDKIEGCYAFASSKRFKGRIGLDDMWGDEGTGKYTIYQFYPSPESLYHAYLKREAMEEIQEFIGDLHTPPSDDAIRGLYKALGMSTSCILDKSPDEYQGENLRCPKCGKIDDSVDPEEYAGIECGQEAEWTCPSCSHSYQFQGRVEVTLISPPLIESRND